MEEAGAGTRGARPRGDRRRAEEGRGAAPAAPVEELLGVAVYAATGEASGFEARGYFAVLGWQDAADDIIRAVEETIADKVVTYDFARQMEGATEVSTSGFADALIERL